MEQKGGKENEKRGVPMCNVTIYLFPLGREI